MKGLYTAAMLLLFPLIISAQPAGYYNNALGKSGEAMRAALYNIIKGHTDVGYSGLWTAYYTTDVKPNGKLATIYSDKPGGSPPYEFTLGTDQNSGGAESSEGRTYNREHTWPRTYFGGAVAPMNSDLWLVYPVDAYINSQRQTYPYGTVASPTKTFQNGTRIGPNVFSGAPSGMAFEPIDSFKGDIARSYFYISTRYYADSARFQDWEMAYNSRLKPWAIQMLLQWHRMDPVSAKEKSRNEAVYALQNNRNPFIDSPRFAECIWAGDCAGLSTGIAHIPAARVFISPNPCRNSVNIQWQAAAPHEGISLDVFDIRGVPVYHSNSASKPCTIDLSAWSAGLYIVQLRSAAGVHIEKLLVQ